jgi:hypothetical protein
MLGIIREWETRPIHPTKEPPRVMCEFFDCTALLDSYSGSSHLTHLQIPGHLWIR